MHLQLTPEQRHEILEEFFFEGEQRPAQAFQFYSLSSLSAVIAAAGLILPSTAVVIGAMLISPLMKPILGIAATMVHGLARNLRPNRTIDTLQKRMVEALHKPVEITVVGSFGFWRSTCPASRACYP